MIVTHNMQQAARVSDRTAFFIVDVNGDGTRSGTIVEFDRTETIFTNPGETTHGGLRYGEVRMTRGSLRRVTRADRDGSVDHGGARGGPRSSAQSMPSCNATMPSRRR